jgi:hypothetical protein
MSAPPSPAQAFWAAQKKGRKPSQLERYETAGAPEEILKFIRLGGGPAMGTTLEKYGRFVFSALQPRAKGGKTETGYDHLLPLADGRTLFVEQKSSGLWSAVGAPDEFKWQHVEPDHKWNILLLCGIGYKEVHFWVMNRPTYDALRAAGKITNQGNAAGDSSEGTWFNYSAVKEHLVPIRSNEDLLALGA